MVCIKQETRSTFFRWWKKSG